MGLRTFRRVLAVTFLIAAVAWLCLGPARFAPGSVVERLQLLPSALASTIGVTIFWIVATLLFGRVYCSTVCPVGTLQDIMIWTRCRLSRRPRPFRFAPAGPSRLPILWFYILSLIVGWLPLAWILEPWNMMREAAALAGDKSAVALTWGQSGRFALYGVAAGTLVLVGVLVVAWLRGRDFCTDICPLGSAMGYATPVTMYHIEIDPDRCVSCMKCEEICASKCVKVVSRYVDNSSCTRCFDCIAVCPEKAIRYQPNRNRRFSSPLMRRKSIHRT